MSEVATFWGSERTAGDPFVAFLTLSVLIHILLFSVGIGEPEAINSPVKDVQRLDQAVDERPGKREVRFDVARMKPERIEFVAPSLLQRLLPTTGSVRAEREAQSLKKPEPINASPVALEVTERMTQADAGLLEAPAAPDKELPKMVTVARPMTFREELRRRVQVRRRHAPNWELAQRGLSLPIGGGRRFHPQRSLLRDPRPSAKPTVDMLDARVKVPEREAARVPGGTPEGTVMRPESLARSAATGAPSPAEKAAAARRNLLPVPQFGMPRVALGDGEREGWSGGGLRGYKLGLLERLKGAAFYPAESRQRHEEGVGTVRFRLNRTGYLENVAVHSASGHVRLDAAALSIVRNASPYRKFPDEVKAPQILFEVDIVFKLGG